MTYAEIETLAKAHKDSVDLDDAQRGWVQQSIEAGEAEEALLVLFDVVPGQFTASELDRAKRAFSGQYGEASANQAIAKARSLVPA